MATTPVVVEKALNAAFARAMVNMQRAREANPGMLGLAIQVPSTAREEKYGWLGAVPGVSEWLGEIKSKELADYDYTIKNKDWAVATRVHENDMDDDQVGSFTPLAELLASRLARYPIALIVDMILNGASNLAYDGIAFFSNASGARTIDNLGAGTGTTLAQLEADLNAALVAGAKFTDDQGEVLNIAFDTIVCPKVLENKFRRLVQSAADPTATAGTDTFNPYNGRFEVIADARLDASDVNDWYLFARNEPVKPFIFQMRQAARPHMEKKPLTKWWVYYAEGRMNAGYGLPHLAYKVVNS